VTEKKKEAVSKGQPLLFSAAVSDALMCYDKQPLTESIAGFEKCNDTPHKHNRHHYLEVIGFQKIVDSFHG
jgi:hypothetical protein